MMIMDTYRAAKDLPKALQTGKEAMAKYPADPGIRTSYALLLGENSQTDDAVKILRAQLHGDANDRDPIFAHGTWEGQIGTEPRGSGGFGYDPIFIPAGMHNSAAQLTPEQKNNVSHRAQALRALVAELRGRHYAGHATR